MGFLCVISDSFEFELAKVSFNVLVSSGQGGSRSNLTGLTELRSEGK